MIIVFHILVALASVASSTVLFFSPSRGKLGVTYGLVGLTLASGTYLVVGSPTHNMVQACTTGLLYLGVVSVGIVTAHYKLATATSKHEK